jgi:hypothetical protein
MACRGKLLSLLCIWCILYTLHSFFIIYRRNTCVVHSRFLFPFFLLFIGFIFKPTPCFLKVYRLSESHFPKYTHRGQVVCLFYYSFLLRLPYHRLCLQRRNKMITLMSVRTEANHTKKSHLFRLTFEYVYSCWIITYIILILLYFKYVVCFVSI